MSIKIKIDKVHLEDCVNLLKRASQLFEKEEYGYLASRCQKQADYITQYYLAYPTIIEQEDYSTWSTEKFKRLIERYREGYHMAANDETARLYRSELVPMEEAFKTLHPRACASWERQFKASFSLDVQE